MRRYLPEGEYLVKFELPVQKPTGCAFGGRLLDKLFVTSVSIGLSDKDRESQPCAGGLFMLETGSEGLADVLFEG